MERIPTPASRKLGSEPSPPPGRLRLEVTVRGRVQGVGFRHFAARHAQALGLHGWVRNAVDGSVRLAAEGPEQELRQLLDLLRQGPSWAHVEDVEASYRNAEGEGPGFRVR